MRKIEAVKWSESKRNEANASRNHENEVSQWAKGILHPHNIHSSKEVYEKENDVCSQVIHTWTYSMILINHLKDYSSMWEHECEDLLTNINYLICYVKKEKWL